MTITTMKAQLAAEYLGISKSKLDKLRVQGGGPAFSKMGRRIVYREKDLVEYLERCLCMSTSQAAKG